METKFSVDKESVFKYLDMLRETAVTNMVGAVPWIVNAFDIDKKEARVLLLEWMETFEERHNDEA